MLKHNRMRQSFRNSVIAAVFAFAQFGAHSTQAQVITSQAGSAAQVDIVATANGLSMQQAYPRSLFLYLQANPNLLNDQKFYVGLVSYLISNALSGDCRDAFSNEFERRDFFTRAFALKPQLQQVIASKAISQRFELSYTIDTGQYDFNTGNLPFDRIASVGQNLDERIGADKGRRCASNLLKGTEVSTKAFPWTFTVVNEAGKGSRPAFPFTNALQLNSTDARTLFEQFGRQLFALVAYQVRSANDGSQRIQVIATDAQLFGLSDNSVVRVKTFAHPTLSQPNYLDITSQLTVQSEILGLDATVQFEQDGFRAVASGQARGRDTGVSFGEVYPVTGSAAVGGTSFIMRIAAPQLTMNIRGLSNQPGAQRFLTLFGGVDFNNVTPSTAPVKGQAIVLEVDSDGTLRETDGFPFVGQFTAPQPAASDTGSAAAPVQATPEE